MRYCPICHHPAHPEQSCAQARRERRVVTAILLTAALLFGWAGMCSVSNRAEAHCAALAADNWIFTAGLSQRELAASNDDLVGFDPQYGCFYID